MSERRTTRNVERFDPQTAISSFEGSDVDNALQSILLQCYGLPATHSGPIETVWHMGGLRRPHLRGWTNEQRKQFIAEPLSSLLPDRFTGQAIFFVNHGELAGKRPRLIPG